MHDVAPVGVIGQANGWRKPASVYSVSRVKPLSPAASSVSRTIAAIVVSGWLASGAAGQTLEIRDYLQMPVTGAAEGTNTRGQLARINGLQEEPGGTGRLFVHDLNGPLYIVDTATMTPMVYLDLNGRGEHSGVFRRFSYELGYANGFVSFQFDPDYPVNGTFYTVHIEEPGVAESALPDNGSVPAFVTAAYETTAAVSMPGDIEREAVLIAWTDSRTSNAIFEGTAREILRVQFNTRIHPMGDLAFNPAARPGDPDWRVLYIGCGDGGSGEAQTAIRRNPQRLDTLAGKILRIIPDVGMHVERSRVSENGRYRIPDDNPFVALAGARAEIWASGLRNPHRLAWDGDTLIAANIGLYTWESAYIVRKGANYGYPLREGHEALRDDNRTTALPGTDRIPVQITGTVTAGAAVPSYPVLSYAHVEGGGDAIAGGFVYRGAALPALRGKYVFGDITTGRLWYADMEEMLAADDGRPETRAPLHEVTIRWNGETYPSMFPVVQAGYHARGGKDPDLPGLATVSGDGRADIRLAVDASGELYILSKSDGMIRVVVAIGGH